MLAWLGVVQARLLRAPHKQPCPSGRLGRIYSADQRKSISTKSDIFLATELLTIHTVGAGVENCCRFLILYTQLKSFGEKLGEQLPELLSKGLQLCVQNWSRINSSPRPPFCRHAMHSYSTAYVKFLRSARARGLLYRKKFYSTVDLLYL